MKKITALLIIMFIGLQVYAKQIDISPLRQEVTVEAGKTAEGFFNVTNVTEEDIEVMAELSDWFVLPENMGIKADEWVDITPNRFGIKAGETIIVPFTVSIPSDAEGELAAKVSFLPVSGHGSSLVVMMSVSLYAYVKGTEKPRIEIAKKSIKKDDDGYSLFVVLKNNGNIHVRPKGMIALIKNRKIVKEIELQYGFPVFPNQERSYLGRFTDEPLQKGKYKATILIDLDYKKMTLKDSFKFSVDKNGGIIKVR